MRYYQNPRRGKLSTLFLTTLCLNTHFEAALGGRVYAVQLLVCYLKNLILNFGHSNQSVLKRSVMGSAVVLVSVTWLIKGFPVTSWKSHLTYKFWKVSQYSISLYPIWKKILKEKDHIIKTESFTLRITNHSTLC